MAKRNTVIFISIIILLIASFLSYQYLIKIYEATVRVEPKSLSPDNQSTVVISVIPLNSFGWEALLRSSPADFEITEGSSLVEIKLLDKEKGKMILKAKSTTGKVVVKIKSPYSLFPMLVEISIQPNYA